MIPHSVLITQPSVNFDQLIGTCSEALDHNVSAGVDNSIKQLSDAEKYISILLAMKGVSSQVHLAPSLLSHISFSVLTAAEDVDMMDMLESCSGMAFVVTETSRRGMLLAVVTGNMQQWRDSIVTGTQHTQPTIRAGFDCIHNLFVQAGLGSVWNSYQQKQNDDNTYTLIEYHP